MVWMRARLLLRYGEEEEEGWVEDIDEDEDNTGEDVDNGDKDQGDDHLKCPR